MPEKCLWCASATKKLKEAVVQQADKQETIWVCSDNCEQDLREYILFVMTNMRRMFFLLIMAYAAGLVIVFTRIKIDAGGFGCFVLFAGSGVLLMRYPFITGQTMRWLGAQRAILSVRVLGAVNIAIGLLFWWRLSLLAANM